MKFYQEITLIDQAEISPYFIWSKLYAQLHIALAEQKNIEDKVSIGVSFPQYIYEEKGDDEKSKVNLGKKLRLFSESESDLKKLDLRKWLERLKAFCKSCSKCFWLIGLLTKSKAPALSAAIAISILP